MGVVYRNSKTSAQFLKPDPKNAMKLFLSVFVTATLLALALSHLAIYELNTTSMPSVDAIKYQNVKSIMIFILNLFFFLLVILSNAYSLARKKLAIFPYVLTIGFYVLFIIKDAYYISDYYGLWQKSLLLMKGDLPDFHQTGLIKCWLGTAVTAFNALMVWWGMRA